MSITEHAFESDHCNSPGGLAHRSERKLILDGVDQVSRLPVGKECVGVIPRPERTVDHLIDKVRGSIPLYALCDTRDPPLARPDAEGSNGHPNLRSGFEGHTVVEPRTVRPDDRFDLQVESCDHNYAFTKDQDGHEIEIVSRD